MKANVHRRRPSERVYCRSLFQMNQVQHLDKHEPTQRTAEN